MRVSYNDNGRVNNPPRAYFPEKPSRVPKLHMSLGRHLFIVTLYSLSAYLISGFHSAYDLP